MAVQTQPPIQLSPDMPTPQMVAFINQNFIQLGATLGQNSFKIADSGQITVTSPTVTGSAVGAYYGSAHVDVNHNLGIVPAFIGFIGISTTAYLPVPYAQFGLNGSAAASFFYDFQLVVDATGISAYINVMLNIFTAGAQSLGSNPYTFTYFLLQQTVT